MINIKIEEVADINSDYNYLEIFQGDTRSPFLEVSISTDKELSFKFYGKADVILNIEELESILIKAKEFLPKVLKNEDDYLNSQQE